MTGKGRCAYFDFLWNQTEFWMTIESPDRRSMATWITLMTIRPDQSLPDGGRQEGFRCSQLSINWAGGPIAYARAHLQRAQDRVDESAIEQ